jgi:hypothetical protein
MVEKGQDIGHKFLSDLDEYLAKSWKTITCDEMADLYYRFFCDLKEFKGNANGFTGLSEYLLFRALYHRLGGDFEKIRVTHDLFEFVSKDGTIRIGQSTPVNLDKKRYYPDIVIYNNDKLVSIIQIKIYLTSGRKEIDKEVETLRRIRERYPGVECTLVIFGAISPASKIAIYLSQRKKDTDGFHSLVLRNNHNSLSKELDRWLALGKR